MSRNYLISKRKPEIGQNGFIVGNRFISISNVFPQKNLVFSLSFKRELGTTDDKGNVSITNYGVIVDREGGFFNGNQYILINNFQVLPVNGDWSLYCEYKMSKLPGDDSHQTSHYLLGNGPNSSSNNTSIILGKTKVAISIKNDSTTYRDVYNPELNVWHKYLITRQGNDYKFWVDNELKLFINNTNNIYDYQPWVISRTEPIGFSGGYLYGYLKNYFVYHKAYTPNDFI